MLGHDNGDPTSHESFRGNQRRAFHGLALVIIQAEKTVGVTRLEVTSPGLKSAEISIEVE